MIIRTTKELIDQYPEHTKDRFRFILDLKNRNLGELVEASISREELKDYKLYWVYEGNLGKVQPWETIIGAYEELGQFGLVLKEDTSNGI